jgi:hypothetical protein
MEEPFDSDKTYISEVKLTELMFRLGFDWSAESKAWYHLEDWIEQQEVIEALKQYEEDR